MKLSEFWSHLREMRAFAKAHRFECMEGHDWPSKDGHTCPKCGRLPIH